MTARDIFSFPNVSLNLKRTAKQVHLYQGDKLLMSSTDCKFWLEGMAGPIKLEGWSYFGESFMEGGQEVTVAVFFMTTFTNSVSTAFVEFDNGKTLFQLHKTDSEVVQFFGVPGSPVRSIGLTAQDGLHLVSSSGFQSPSLLGHKFFPFGLGGKTYIPVMETDKDKFDVDLTLHNQDIPIRYYSSPRMSEAVNVDTERSMKPLANLYDVEEGKCTFSKNVNSTHFFGMHCIVTKQGWSNVYSPTDGFLSPVWFNSCFAMNKRGHVCVLNKNSNLVFLVLGNKYVPLRRQEPFSLSNAKEFTEDMLKMSAMSVFEDIDIEAVF